MFAERLADDPLPRIELEERGDRPAVEVNEAFAVPANLLDVDACGIEPRLDCGIAQVIDRAAILEMMLYGGEVDRGFADAEPPPCLDQLSWMELNWSRPGSSCSSQSHCTTAASNTAVGVSALYSTSCGGLCPS